MAYPVASTNSGMVKYSDGSVKGNASTSSGYASNVYVPRTVRTSGNYQQPVSSYQGTQTSLGGGGGGGSSAPQGDMGGNFMGSGMNEGDYMGQLNGLYDESLGLLNQQEQSTLAGKQDFLNQYTQPFDAQKPLLEQAYQAGVGANQNQQYQSQLSERSAIDDARRLYNELGQGVKQRFGGSNSAGEFANAFYGREFQRQTGNIQNTAGQNMQTLLGKAQEIRQQYDAQLSSLEMQKNAALSQARDAFQQRLDAINNARLGIAQNKAQLKLQALQEFRANVMNVQAQAQALAQNLAVGVANQTGNIQNAIKTYQTASQQLAPQASLPGAQFARIGGSVAQTPMIAGNLSGYRREEFA